MPPDRPLSLLKTATLIFLMAPAVWLSLAYAFDLLGAKPNERLIEEMGSFAIRFLLLSLAISPLRSILRWPALIGIRRRIGVASFFYALAHLGLFALDREFGPARLLVEIFKYPYLTIGFVTLVALLPLAATSTDWMIKQLGARRWRLLHRAVYVIAPLGLLHFILESPTDSIEPLVLGGCFCWLMAYRLRQRFAKPGFAAMLLLAIVATLGTAVAEALFLSLKLGASFISILPANLSFATGLRPAQLVLCFCILAVIGFISRAERRSSSWWRSTKALSTA